MFKKNKLSEVYAVSFIGANNKRDAINTFLKILGKHFIINVKNKNIDKTKKKYPFVVMKKIKL